MIIEKQLNTTARSYLSSIILARSQPLITRCVGESLRRQVLSHTDGCVSHTAFMKGDLAISRKITNEKTQGSGNFSSKSLWDGYSKICVSTQLHKVKYLKVKLIMSRYWK